MRHHTFLLQGKLISKISVIAGALILVAGVFVWSVAGRTAPSSAAAAPSCTTANLDVWLNTTGNGAAGSSYYNLNFTNLSAHSCALLGYPGVSAITQAGIQLGSSARRNAEHPRTLVVLTSARSARGFEISTSRNTATVILQITVAENFPLSVCAPLTAAGLRVYPPGQKESTVVPFPFVACVKVGPQFLHVEAVQRYVAVST
ncbi:MAG: DUF4232 domain-containing protein [Acidimicrobiales bacterium]